MKYFDSDFLEFFKELAANNNKDWFDANRKRYEKSVKKPFENFVAAVLEASRQIDPSILAAPKDCIFRINKDIRFSQDKSPYKLDRSAIISEKGRKDHSSPGFYVSLGPEYLSVGGGAYFLQKDQLEAVRNQIANQPKEFEKIISDKSFKKHFGEVQGEENKRLPKELKEASEEQPLLFKKQFYYMAHLEPEIIETDQLMPTVIKHFEAGAALSSFLKEAIS